MHCGHQLRNKIVRVVIFQDIMDNARTFHILNSIVHRLLFNINHKHPVRLLIFFAHIVFPTILYCSLTL